MAYVNICPVIEGKMDFREDCYLDDRIWGEKDFFLHKHFGDRRIKTATRKLNKMTRFYLSLCAQNEKVYEAFGIVAMLPLLKANLANVIGWVTKCF